MAIDITGLNKIELLVALFNQAKKEQSKKNLKLSTAELSENDALNALKTNKRILNLNGVRILCDLSNDKLEVSNYKTYDDISGGKGTFEHLVKEQREKQEAEKKAEALRLATLQDAQKVTPQKFDIAEGSQVLFTLAKPLNYLERKAGDESLKTNYELPPSKKDLDAKFTFEDRFTQFDDRLAKDKLVRFLKDHGFADAVQSIYKDDRSNVVVILMNSHDERDKLVKLLSDHIQKYCGYHEVPKHDLQASLMPSPLFCALLGAKIPFGKSAVSNPDGDLDPSTQEIKEQFEILLPVLEAHLAPYLAEYLAKHFKQFDPMNFKALHHLPTLNEHLYALSQAKKTVNTEEIAKIADLFSVVDSRNYAGFKRSVFQPAGLVKAIRTYFENVKDKEMGEKFIRALFIAQPATCIDSTVLSQFLIRYFDTLDKSGNLPECRLMPARQFQKGMVSVPLYLDVPALHSATTHNIIIIDTSGSMSDDRGDPGRLTHFKKAALETVHMLMKKPGQLVTLIEYNTVTTLRLNRVSVDLQNIEEIQNSIHNLNADNTTLILSALQMAWQCINPNENTTVILGTDGSFHDFGDESLFEKNVRAIMSSHKVPVKTFGMDIKAGDQPDKALSIITSFGDVGSQQIFTPSKDIMEKVQSLIMENTNQPIQSAKVTLIVDGKEISTNMLPSFVTNEPSLQYISIPMNIIEQMQKQSGKISAKFEFVLKDNTQKMLQVIIPLEHLNQVTVPTVYEKQHFDQLLLSGMLLDCGIENIEVLESMDFNKQLPYFIRILNKIEQRDLTSVRPLINTVLQNSFAKDFEIIKGQVMKSLELQNDFSNASVRNKIKIIEGSRKLFLEVIDGQNVQEKINLEQIKSQCNDLIELILAPFKKDLWLEDCKNLIAKQLYGVNISTSVEIDLRKNQLVEVLRQTLLECEKNPRMGQGFIETIRKEIDALWLESTLAELAEKMGLKAANLKEFGKLDELEQYGLLDALRSEAEKQGKNEAKKTISDMIGKVYLAGEVCKVANNYYSDRNIKSLEDFKKFSSEEQYKIYQEIMQNEATKEYPEVISALTEILFKLEFEIQLKKQKFTLDAFDKLATKDRLIYYKNMLNDDTLDKTFVNKVKVVLEAAEKSIEAGFGEMVPAKGHGTSATGYMREQPNRGRYIRNRPPRANIDPVPVVFSIASPSVQNSSVAVTAVQNNDATQMPAQASGQDTPAAPRRSPYLNRAPKN